MELENLQDGSKKMKKCKNITFCHFFAFGSPCDVQKRVKVYKVYVSWKPWLYSLRRHQKKWFLSNWGRTRCNRSAQGLKMANCTSFKILTHMRFDCILPEFSPFRNFKKNIGKLNSLTVRKKKKKKKKSRPTDPIFKFWSGEGNITNFFFGLKLERIEWWERVDRKKDRGWRCKDRNASEEKEKEREREWKGKGV